jgi:hypothetical protein
MMLILFKIIFTFIVNLTTGTKQFKRLSFKIFTITLILAFQGCSLIHPVPNDKDALSAIRTLMGDDLFHLPDNFIVSEVNVISCKWQESPPGHVCNVNLISAEMPLLGAIKVPMQLRFVKKKDHWKAFIL